MNTTAILLLLSVPLQNPNGAAPQLTMARGEIVVHHGAQSFRATRSDSIPAGSRISTGAGSQASIYWRPGLVVYLDEQTSVALTGTAENPLVSLGQGSIRTVATNAAIIMTNQTRTSVRRGVVRHTARDGNTVISGLRGEIWTADLSAISRDGVQLTRGQASQTPDMRNLSAGLRVVHRADQGFTQIGDAAGNSESQFELLQLQTVVQVSRQQRGASSPPPPPPLPDSKPPASPTDDNQGDETTRGADDPLASAADDEPPAATSSSGTGAALALGTSGINLALGNVSLSTAAGGAGGLFTDANQATNAGMLQVAVPEGIARDLNGAVITGGLAQNANFPGNIHPITSETVHSFVNVDLVFSDNFPLFRQFWSIGEGALPTGQVSTGIGTGTGTTPETIRIPQFDNYLIRLDQYGITDPASATAGDSVSISGLVGANPVNPNIQGADPLNDQRLPTTINDRLTFALGELAVDRDGTTPQLVVRRSDQDRQIIKDPGGNDANDQVTVNPQVQGFEQVEDPLFFPSNDSVFIPDRSLGADLLSNRPSFGNLGFLRKAAATTLMADQLFDFAQRTGQTRFVVDGKILDISGYQR